MGEGNGCNHLYLSPTVVRFSQASNAMDHAFGCSFVGSCKTSTVQLVLRLDRSGMALMSKSDSFQYHHFFNAKMAALSSGSPQGPASFYLHSFPQVPTYIAAL